MNAKSGLSENPEDQTIIYKECDIEAAANMLQDGIKAALRKRTTCLPVDTAERMKHPSEIFL